MAATFVTLKTRGRLDRVNFRNEFWDCYQGQLKKKMAPVAIPETTARHISAPDLFPFQKWRMYSPRLALTIGFFSTRPGREPWERGWSYPLLWLGFTKAPCKQTKHCWQQLTTLLDITCCVRLHTHPVACCWKLLHKV